MDNITLKVEIELYEDGLRIVGSRKRENGSSEEYKTVPASHFDDFEVEDCIEEINHIVGNVIESLIQNN